MTDHDDEIAELGRMMLEAHTQAWVAVGLAKHLAGHPGLKGEAERMESEFRAIPWPSDLAARPGNLAPSADHQPLLFAFSIEEITPEIVDYLEGDGET